MTDKPSKAAAKQPRAPEPRRDDPAAATSTGEEDPGASLGDTALRDAMQGEVRAAGQQAGPKSKRRSGARDEPA
jgi:hypothetical protein